MANELNRLIDHYTEMRKALNNELGNLETALMAYQSDRDIGFLTDVIAEFDDAATDHREALNAFLSERHRRRLLDVIE